MRGSVNECLQELQARTWFAANSPRLTTPGVVVIVCRLRQV